MAPEIENLPAVITATMICSRVLVTALLAAFAFSAIGQTPPFREITPVPDDAIYDSFFYRVAWLEEHSTNLIQQGKRDTVVRSAIRTQANLTIPEEVALKTVVADYRENSAALAAAARTLRAAGPQAPDSQQLQNLRSQRLQMITDHISQLREALGPERFRDLDAFVRRTSTVRRYEILPPVK
jgi:hypothetical protein